MPSFYAELLPTGGSSTKPPPPFPNVTIPNLSEFILDVLVHDFGFPIDKPLIADGQLHRSGDQHYALKVFPQGPVAVFTSPDYHCPVCTVFNEGAVHGIDVHDWAGRHLREMPSKTPGHMLIGAIEVDYTLCH